MAKKKELGRPVEQQSLTRAKSTKEYRELMQKVNDDMDFWSKTIEKVTGEHKDKVMVEVQAIYLDNLRKAGDLPALARENVANLMMKQKVSTMLKQKMLEAAVERATLTGNEEDVEKAEKALLEYAMNTTDDYKIFKALNEGIKTISNLAPRKVQFMTQEEDDKMILDVVEGVYTKK